jgi:TonB family protein
MNGNKSRDKEQKMKKAFLIFVALWLLMVGVLLKAENAVRIDAQKRPKIIKQVKPIYPKEAYAQKIQGAVELEATINTTGDVVGVKVLPAKTPQPLLEKAAVTALRQWKYAPYLIGGKAKAVIFTVSVNFMLAEKPPVVPAEERPKLVNMVKPVYPEEAVKQRIEGTVKIEATIDDKGDIADARVLPAENSQPLLEEAALTAVKQWKYEPYVKAGKTLSVTFTVTLNFKLQ